MIRVCDFCGKDYFSVRKKKYCSLKCCTSSNAKPTSVALRMCQYKPCSKQFEGSANKKFCSKNCRTYHSHGDTFIPGVKAREKANKVHICPIYLHTCPITGKSAVSRYNRTTYHPSVTQAQIEQRRRKHRNRSTTIRWVKVQRITKTCIDCSSPFETTIGRPYIRCKECSLRYNIRVVKARRRAREKQLPNEPIDPFIVFRKYDWKCASCSKHTPRSARGTGQHNSPELDHIIPLSKGGTHTYNNVQLLCRSCNNSKADNVTVPIRDYSQEGRVDQRFIHSPLRNPALKKFSSL